jgi:hypothetical protein
MEIDRIPHMGGALRDEAPPWQKPGNQRRKFVEEIPEGDGDAEKREAAEDESDPQEERGMLDVVA